MRVVSVGLGPLGLRLAQDAARRGKGALVGAVDVDPTLAGRPLGELVPGAAEGATVVARVEDAPAADVALVATVSELDRCAPTLRALLGRGTSVVSTCEELAWPHLRHADLARELDELARRHGARLLGTGINPGFLMDAFPAVATAVCDDVRALVVTRRQDAATRRVPFQRKVGATLDEATFRELAEARQLGHVGLPESLHLLAATLGLELERWDETIEPVLARDDLDSGLGPIAAGRVAGLRQVARGTATQGTELRLEFRATIGEPSPLDRVRVEGTPPVELTWKGGVPGDVSTSAVLLNAIPSLLAAAPGLHTMATLPLVSWR